MEFHVSATKDRNSAETHLLRDRETASGALRLVESSVANGELGGEG